MANRMAQTRSLYDASSWSYWGFSDFLTLEKTQVENTETHREAPPGASETIPFRDFKPPT